MSHKKPTGSFELSARCMAGNGLGAVPLHHVTFDGGFRAHSSRDAAGVATASLADNGGLAAMEGALLAIARDGNAMMGRRAGSREAPTMCRLAALVMQLLTGPRESSWLQGARAMAQL